MNNSCTILYISILMYVYTKCIYYINCIEVKILELETSWVIFIKCYSLIPRDSVSVLCFVSR